MHARTEIETKPAPWSARRAAGLFVAFGLLLALRPVLAGANPAHAVAWFASVAAFVWLPGSVCVRWLDPDRDTLSRLFLAFVTGLALLALVFVTLCALDARGAVWIVPAGALVVHAIQRARRGQRDVTPIPLRDLLALTLPLAVVLWRAQLESPTDWYRGFDTDPSFHVANAAELRWRWPMGDPRLAGEPLRYHFLSYVPAAVASVVTGLPVRECLLGLGAHLLPTLFALGLFVTARALGAGAWIAALAATALVLHADLGALAEPLFGTSLAFTSPFDAGLYASITTAQGMCAALAIVLVLRDVLRESPHSSSTETSSADAPRTTGVPWRRIAWLALLAFLASGSKSSVMPPILAGMAAVWLWRHWKREPLARGYVPAQLALCAGSLPFLAWLSLESQGYARSMFTWTFSAAQVASPFQWGLVRALGGEPSVPNAWITAAIFPVWCIGFFGAGALALWAWTITRTRPVAQLEAVLFATFLAGLCAAVLVSAPGASQLFFAYDAQIAALLLGAVAAARWQRAPRAARTAIALGSALLAIQLFVCARYEATLPRPERELAGDSDSYRATLEWIRTSTPPDAVFLLDEPRLAADQWTERRAFYGTTRFSPRYHQGFVLAGNQPSRAQVRPFAERKRMQEQLFADPCPATLRSIRAAIGCDAPIYALRTRIELTRTAARHRIEWRPLECASSFGDEAGLELVYASATTAVYRLPN